VAYAIKIVFCHDFPLRHSPTNAVIYPIHLEAAIAIYDPSALIFVYRKAHDRFPILPLRKIFHISIKAMDDVVQTSLTFFLH